MALAMVMCAAPATAGLKLKTDAAQDWGSPQVIYNTWEFGKGHDKFSKYPDMTFWIMDKVIPAHADDEAIVMLYTAREIVSHGGYFCATQARSRNKGSSGCPKIWTTYQAPDGDVEKTCFWLCEPGYSGVGCKPGRVTSAEACKYTKLNANKISEFISYNQTENWDRNEVESLMLANRGFFVYAAGSSNSQEYDVILAAKSFLKNGHGIVASPATVSAHGGTWTVGDWASVWFKCKGGVSNLTVTANTGNYQTKTLCMPGFDGENCTTEFCQDCDDPLTKYNSTTGMCSDCVENHIRVDSSDMNNKDRKLARIKGTPKCTPCGEGETAVNQSFCLKCEPTQEVVNGTCVPRAIVTKSQLLRCYPNELASDYRACLDDVCEDGNKVGCVNDNGIIGRKTCTNKKWGACVIEN